MYLRWKIIEQADGSFRVPPGPSDGEIADADQVYPTIEDVMGDLYDAVICEYLPHGPCNVSLTFEREAAS